MKIKTAVHLPAREEEEKRKRERKGGKGYFLAFAGCETDQVSERFMRCLESCVLRVQVTCTCFDGKCQRLFPLKGRCSVLLRGAKEREWRKRKRQGEGEEEE